MQVAFFDFDGTITSKDSLLEFIQFAVGKPRYYWGLLVISPILVGFVLKLIVNDVAKQKMLGHFFKGWSVERFEQVASDYSLTQIDKILRPKAKQKLTWHLSQGHKVVIVSASIDAWLKPWCDKQGFELIATKMANVDGKISGLFADKNCHGEEKVNKIQKNYDLNQFETIFAYGDTSGDKPMLALAHHAYYREFE